MWAGVSTGSGGEIIVGLDKSAGCLLNMRDPPEACRYILFQTVTTSIGVGLGGSANLSFVLGLNIDTSSDLEDAGLEDSVDFAADFVIRGTAQYIRSIPNYLEFFHEFDKGWKGAIYAGNKALTFVEKHEKLKGYAEKIYQNVSSANAIRVGKAALLVVPIGIGLRLSIKYKCTVLDVLGSGIVSLK